MILQANPYERPSYEQILWHPFMNSEVAIPKSIKTDCLYNDPSPEYIKELEQSKNEKFGLKLEKPVIDKSKYMQRSKTLAPKKVRQNDDNKKIKNEINKEGASKTDIQGQIDQIIRGKTKYL